MTTIATGALHLSHRERSDRQRVRPKAGPMINSAIRVRGCDLTEILDPLTPTLSPMGRGSAPSSWLSRHPEATS